MAIDLGNDPGGTPPTTAEKLQIRSAIGVGTTDAPTFGQFITLSDATNFTYVNFGGSNQIQRESNLMWFSSAGSRELGFTVNGPMRLRQGGGISWWDDIRSGTLKASLFSSADNIIEQRNGTSAQAFRVYDTYDTAGTNYERGTFGFPIGTNTLRIGTEQAGTGAAQPIEFVTGEVVRMSIAAAGNVSIAGVFNFGSSNGVLPGGTIYGGHLGTSQYFAIRGTSASATAIYIQNGSSVDKQGWVRVLGSGSVDHGALEVGALDSSPVIFTTALTERMRLSAGGNLGIGTATPASKLTVTSGDIEVDTVTSGIILKAAGTSTRYRLTLNAGGTALVFTAV